MHAGIVESFFLIFAGAAVLAAAALYTRQPLLVAYIAVGGIAGPHGLGWVNDASMVSEISEFGIIFLLFLVGLDLQPSKLRNMVGSAVVTAMVSSLIFFAASVGVMRAFGFSWIDATVAGTACMFSSTIVGLKLLPTTVLHHRHIGELVVSLLLIQDLIAILSLIILSGRGTSVTDAVGSVIEVFVALPSLAIVAFVVVRFLVLPLIHKFDAFHEFIFLAAIGWCLAVACGAKAIGLSLEIGAFVAGVSWREPDRAIHRGEPTTVARLLPGDVLLLGRRSDPFRSDVASRAADARARGAAHRAETHRVSLADRAAGRFDEGCLGSRCATRSNERVFAACGLSRDEHRVDERRGIARRAGRYRTDVRHLRRTS